MTLVVPARARLQLTTNILPTAVRNASRRDHEILLVVDECDVLHEIRRRPGVFVEEQTVAHDAKDRALLRGWIDAHRELLSASGVRVLRSAGDERCWTGGLRTSAALNVGVEAAQTEWIVGIGDEDLCFSPGWDDALWSALGGRDPRSTVSTLVMAMPMQRETWPEPLTARWIHMQRDRVCHQLTFPVRPEHSGADSARISESSWLGFAQLAKLGGVYEEQCHERKMCHWVPMLMHRDLLRRVGTWPIRDEAAFSFDIYLDDQLGAAGVRKRMRLDNLVLHSKHHLFMGEDVDRQWADPGVVEALRARGGPVL